MTRIAIATGVHLRPQETQIRFHMRTLFGGNTVVLAGKRGEPDPDNRPHLIWGRSSVPLGLAEEARAFALAAAAYPDTRSLRVPFGARRRMILEFLAAQGVDAILAEFGTEAVRLAPVANAAGLPIFAYFRGADASSYLSRGARIAAYRRMMPRLAGVFSVSRFLLDRLESHVIRHPHAQVVPSGVDVARFQPGKKQPESFLAVGRFIEKKRPATTVRAFCTAARGHPEARLEMIGDGPLLEPCRKLAAELGMADRVTFHGRQPHDVVAARLADCAVFLQHSVTGPDGDTEGLPTAIQEAMAAGMMVIATRHAGIPEAVTEGETGLLVAEGDEAAYTAQIAETLAGRHDVAAMGARAREIACDRFDNRKLIATVEATLAAAVEAQRNAASQGAGRVDFSPLR